MRNVIVESYNNSETDSEAVFQHDFSTHLFEDPSQYKVAVTRLKVPTSSLQTFHTTGDEFWLSYLNDAKYYLPNLPYYSQDDVLEAINRMLQAAHETYWTLQSTTVARTFTFTAGTDVTETFAITTAYTKSAFVRVIVGDIAGTGDVRIYLTSPGGLKTLVYSGAKPTEQITISEASQYDSGAFIRPRDTLLNAANEAPNGNWTVQIVCDDATTDSVSVQLMIRPVDTADSAILSPFVEFASDERMVLNYQQLNSEFNLVLKVNPKMKTLLGFPSRWTKEGDDYRWTYPSGSLDHTDLTQLQSVTQGLSHKYMLINLDKIVVTSNIAIDADIFLSDQHQEAILADFVLDPAQELEYLQYSVENTPWRKFQINSTYPINSLTVRLFAEYANGHRQTVIIAPSESLFVRLSFFRNNALIAL